MTISENGKNQPPAIVVGKRGPGRPKNREQIDPGPVLRDYLEGKHTVAQIGRTHGVSAVTVCNWAIRAGVPRRRRGRRVMAEPSDRDREILEAVKTRTYKDVGQEHGLSRQRVEQILRRWGRRNGVVRGKERHAAPIVTVQGAKKAPKSCVISFRLSPEEASRLCEFHGRVGLRKSGNPVHEAARRIIVSAIGHGSVKANEAGVYNSYLMVPVCGLPSELISKMLG